MSFGVSVPIHIGGESFSPLLNMKMSPIEYDGITVNPPTPNGTQPSNAMKIYQNPFKDFAFQKISPSVYGPESSLLPRYTGLPANEPDYIADYHFISLMRLIDKFMKHSYVGYINGTMTTTTIY